MKQSAIVIGGGPAGSSAAIGLLRSGFSVTLLEARSQTIPRVCGAFLNSEAMRHLRWLGVIDSLKSDGVVPTPVTRLSSFGVEGTAVSTTRDQQETAGCPRSVLEDRLLKEVQRLGGEVRMGCRILDQHRDYEKHLSIVTYRKIEPVQTDLGFFSGSQRETPQGAKLEKEEASLVVLAAGRFSLSSHVPQRKSSGWYGWNALFKNVEQKPGEQSLFFFPKGYVGVLTFANGESNVCGLIQKVENDHRSWNEIFHDVLERRTAFKKMMAGAERLTDWKGVGPLPFSQRMRRSQGALLVGDAAAVADPFMGEGIGRALSAGPMISKVLAEMPPNNFSPEKLVEKYNQVWVQHYSSRLSLGRWARRLIGHEILFHLIWAPLSHRPWIVNKLTPVFHSGFISEN